MTISVCWQRKFKGVDEIVFASDSRLSAGYRWDCAQKIFPIDGPNFCISFAGDADFAFPCIFQFKTLVKNYKRYNDGAAQIHLIANDFMSLCNHMLSAVDDRKIAQFNRTEFILAGYNFETGAPFQRILYCDRESGAYKFKNFRGIKTGNNGCLFGFAGDLREKYYRTLSGFFSKNVQYLDLEPIKALSQTIDDEGRDSSVGGFPQIVKVYKHRNYLPYAVKKNNGAAEIVSLYGRSLLPHERTLYPILDVSKIGQDDCIHYPMAPTEPQIGTA